jgi:prepilin-type N-terminal cleavage/methylation domain-containing protein
VLPVNAGRTDAGRRGGFSLVELLVVMGILVVLMSMLLPMLKMAQRQTRKTMTLAVFQKVDTALHLFRNEIGSYPWQASYLTDAQLAAGQAWTNNLYYNLGTNIAASDLTKLRNDADTASNQYGYRVTGGDAGDPRWTWTEQFSSDGGVTWSVPANPQAFRKTDVRPGDSRIGIGRDAAPSTDTSIMLVPTAVVLNRLAAERARRAVYAGNVGITGVKMQTYTVANGGTWNGQATWNDRSPSLSTISLISAPQSAGKPGWAHDYFTGLLEKRFIGYTVVGGVNVPTTILDGYGRPLIYVCQVTEGVKAPSRMVLMRDYGARIDPMVYGLARTGRTILQTVDPVTGAGTTLTANPPYLPDVTNLMHSDRTLYAAPGFEGEPELWSAGWDGAFRWMRDDATNADNLSLLPYDAPLQ